MLLTQVGLFIASVYVGDICFKRKSASLVLL